jgi:hypothetical protein
METHKKLREAMIEGDEVKPVQIRSIKKVAQLWATTYIHDFLRAPGHSHFELKLGMGFITENACNFKTQA